MHQHLREEMCPHKLLYGFVLGCLGMCAALILGKCSLSSWGPLLCLQSSSLRFLVDDCTHLSHLIVFILGFCNYLQ